MSFQNSSLLERLAEHINFVKEKNKSGKSKKADVYATMVEINVKKLKNSIVIVQSPKSAKNTRYNKAALVAALEKKLPKIDSKLELIEKGIADKPDLSTLKGFNFTTLVPVTVVDQFKDSLIILLQQTHVKVEGEPNDEGVKKITFITKEKALEIKEKLKKRDQRTKGGRTLPAKQPTPNKKTKKKHPIDPEEHMRLREQVRREKKDPNRNTIKTRRAKEQERRNETALRNLNLTRIRLITFSQNIEYYKKILREHETITSKDDFISNRGKTNNVESGRGRLGKMLKVGRKTSPEDPKKERRQVDSELILIGILGRYYIEKEEGGNDGEENYLFKKPIVINDKVYNNQDFLTILYKVSGKTEERRKSQCEYILERLPEVRNRLLNKGATYKDRVESLIRRRKQK